VTLYYTRLAGKLSGSDLGLQSKNPVMNPGHGGLLYERELKTKANVTRRWSIDGDSLVALRHNWCGSNYLARHFHHDSEVAVENVMVTRQKLIKRSMIQ